MKLCRQTSHPVFDSLCKILLVLSCLNTARAESRAGFAAGKFIPTFAICYSDARGARSPEETARFDMLVCSASKRAASAWGQHGRNSWQSLKALNPGMVIAVYAMGQGEYNTADWGQMGEGWQWMKQNHGKDSADRWIAVGEKSSGYLQ